MILSKIIEEKRKSVEELKNKRPQAELIKLIEKPEHPHRFRREISKEHNINLIAEIKKASPSKGILRDAFDPLKIASTYQMNGASAISVLTEEQFFLGSIEHLKQVKDKISLPILRKDFVIDSYQVYESAYYKAEAVLLIADILSSEEIKTFVSISSNLGMDAVVEVHNEEDIQKALKADAKIIGINNRDLHTFHVDMNTTTRLIKDIPDNKIVISESGIKTHQDIMFLKSLGIKAVLIGEAFMLSEDIGAKVRELLGH